MVGSAVPPAIFDEPLAIRLEYFRSRTAAHPRLKEAHEAVLRAIRVPAGAALVIVYGPSGVGKTTLRLRVQQQLSMDLQAELERDPGRLPVVGLEAVASDAGDFRWRDFYRRLLVTMGEPMIEYKVRPARLAGHPAEQARSVSGRAGTPELRYAVEQALRHRRPAAVLIDEAQHLRKIASGRRLLDQLDTLKSLASMTGVVHVLLGTYELLALTNLSGQLNRRTIDVHFPRYRADSTEDLTCFRNVVRSLQQHLPVQQAPDLVVACEELYEGSAGCVGVLKDWLMRSLALALEDGRSALTHHHLAAQALSRIKRLQMAREIREGEERLAEDDRVTSELRTVLGMEPIITASDEGCTPAKAATARMTSRPRAHRRVGERNPVRDRVGDARNVV